MIRTSLVGSLLAATAVAQEEPAAKHPVLLDRTGIAWQVPFESAREKATESKRIIAIKPVAFGTTLTGCW